MDVEWIKQQIETKNISQLELSAAIGLSPVQLNKTLNGTRSLKSSEADKIRHFFGYRLPEEPKPTAPVVGRVGAGEQVPLVDPYAKGDGIYSVFVPSVLEGKKVVAVEVSGQSMSPTFESGDLLFYSRDAVGVPQESINNNCICCDSEGNAWVKRLKLGSEPGLYNLLSINPASDNIHNAKIEWAAKVFLHLPSDLIEFA